MSGGSPAFNVVDIGAVGASGESGVGVAGAASGGVSAKSTQFTIGSASPKDDAVRSVEILCVVVVYLV